eukprot:3567692-Prymnesium_polylepis.1
MQSCRVRVVLVALLAIAAAYELLAWRAAPPAALLSSAHGALYAASPPASYRNEEEPAPSGIPVRKAGASPQIPRPAPPESELAQFRVVHRLPGHETFNYTALVDRCASQSLRTDLQT